jgi:autotransporter translocation and assembly factor TamB
LLVAAAVWFLGTPGGTRWILSFISARSTVKVSAAVIEGKLWGDLGIEKLQIRWPEGFATAEHVHIRWQPLALVLMRVSASELMLRQVYIQDNSPEKPVDLTWPSIDGIPSPVTGKIKTLTVEGLVYRKRDEAPLTASKISSSAYWFNNVLSLRNLSLSMPSVSVRGSASAGFVRPRLKTDLIIELANPAGKIKRVVLKCDLSPSKSPVLLDGPISIIAAPGDKDAAELSGELGVEKKALVLKKLIFSRTGAAGKITGEGRISFAEAAPEFESKLEINGLDLSPEISMRTDVSGRISLKGTGKSYQGEWSLANKSEDWRSAGITGRFEGNRQGLKVEIENGSLLKGKLSGILHADLSKGIELQGKLRGRDLNPSVISPDWKGAINLDVDADADLSGKETRGNIKARLLESSLRNRSLAGSLNAGFRGGDVRIADFSLGSREFDLHAKGELQKRLSFTANVSTLSFLVPDAEGSLRAEGWTKLEEGNFSGTVSGKARGVVYQGVRLEALDLAASLSGLNGQPVDLKADIRGFAYKKIYFDRISGHAGGKILPGRLLNFSGDIAVTKGSIIDHAAKGLVSAKMKTARILWTWQGETLQGELSMLLAENGSLKGRFSLPVPARIPVALNTAGPLKADLSAKIKESGILTSFFPGMVQESHGDLDLSLKAAGTWSVPVLAGTLQLEHAGGFFPSIGIKLKNVLMRGHFDKNKVAIDRFQAESGKGKLNGAVSFLIEKWQIKSYSGSLEGSNFRAVYLPDLKAEISPKITFTGDGKKFSMRGDISVKNFLIAESKTPPHIEPSKDVIIVDRKQEEAKNTPLQLDMEVHVMLGDHLFIKAEGIDAQLKGDIVMTAHGINDIRGRGTLRVVKGTYKNYGVDLKIERGSASFAGGKIDNPALDVLAVRSVNDIRAGVAVNGTLEKPIIKMYSEPPMPQTDILAYIVFGHPLGGGSGEQASLLFKVAGTLLSGGDSTVLQDQLKTKLGLDVLDVESTGAPAGTAAGAVTGASQSTATRSLLTVGKYLSPKLFISYGQSVFSKGGLFKMRYNLSKHFDIESQSGVESGVDFVYKIDLK